MKKILILFCLLVSFTIKAESFNYMYFGKANQSIESYTRVNVDPVVLNFIEELEAIQLVFEGNSIMFYVVKIYEGESGTIIKTVASDGRQAGFSIDKSLTIFSLGEFIYVITNLPKYKW